MDSLVRKNIELQESLDSAKDIIEGLCYQFADREVDERGNVCKLWSMGMSDLEAAFAFLGWDDPHFLDI